MLTAEPVINQDKQRNRVNNKAGTEARRERQQMQTKGFHQIRPLAQ